MKAMRIFKSFAAAVVASALVLGSGAAFAGDPQTFVEHEHNRLTSLLRQPASAARDTQVNHTLETMVDYDELTRRAFGKPCPVSVPACTNWWDKFSADDQRELTDLMKRLVEKNYRKNLQKTLDYDISYRGTKPVAGAANASETRVITEAKAKDKPREPAVRVDYVILPNGGKEYVVDIYTENSSLTKNYYSDFNRMMLNPAQGLAHVKKRLIEKGSQP